MLSRNAQLGGRLIKNSLPASSLFDPAATGGGGGTALVDTGQPEFFSPDILPHFLHEADKLIF